LLPHLANCLVSTSMPPGYFIAEDSSIYARLSDSVAASISKFGTEPSALLNIMRDSSRAGAVRAAAAMIYLLHKNADGVFAGECDHIIEAMYESASGVWYVKAAGVALQSGVEKNRLSALNAMGQLLQLSRNEFNSRVATDFVLYNWREISKAPVHRASDQELWR
jgi:hypothetical protein